MDVTGRPARITGADRLVQPRVGRGVPGASLARVDVICNVILLHTFHIDGLAKYLPVKGSAKLNVTDFIKQFITFILIIVISFVFVKVAFGYLLGVTDTKKASDASNPSNPSNVADSSNIASVIASKEAFSVF